MMTDRTPSSAPSHRTRAERRAAEGAATAQPDAPLTRAQLRQRARAVTVEAPTASAAAAKRERVPVGESEPVVEPAEEREPAMVEVRQPVPQGEPEVAALPHPILRWEPEQKAEPVLLRGPVPLPASRLRGESASPGLFPDQFAGSGIRFDDRTLPPVVPVPAPTPFVHVPRVSSLPAAANGPARTSLVIAGLAAVSGLIAHPALRADPVLAGVVNLAVVTLLIAAFLLAAVGLVLAVRRPTRKLIPVVAIMVSVFALAAVAVLVAARAIPLGGLLAA